jgi:prepilin-type processing-associated H-X9-DG protein
VEGYSANGTAGAGCGCINVFNVNQIYAFHTGGANALRCDGSVGFLKASTSPVVLAGLITRANGEVIPDD